MTNSSFKALSTISANFSALFAASMVVPVIIGQVEFGRLPVLSLGLAMSVIAGLLSLYFAERGKL